MEYWKNIRNSGAGCYWTQEQDPRLITYLAPLPNKKNLYYMEIQFRKIFFWKFPHGFCTCSPVDSYLNKLVVLCSNRIDTGRLQSAAVFGAGRTVSKWSLWKKPPRCRQIAGESLPKIFIGEDAVWFPPLKRSNQNFIWQIIRVLTGIGTIAGENKFSSG